MSSKSPRALKERTEIGAAAGEKKGGEGGGGLVANQQPPNSQPAIEVHNQI